MVDQGSEGWLSPWLRRARMQSVQPYLQGRVLDFGCGSGELTRFCSPDQYYGVDADVDILAVASQKFPSYQFGRDFLDQGAFDTIVLLAVIEHLTGPVSWLAQFKGILNPFGQLLLTTPHPRVDGIHTLGAKLGLFSAHANEEHEELFDKQKMAALAEVAGLKLLAYKPFLFGANQLFRLGST
jgi:2-polyprenyl-3-methyl-5-hydroxy-6-metoxy-1,4-benzoquinol methylase